MLLTDMAPYEGNTLISPAMPDRHMMLDIETLDVEPTAAIIAIGALTFNPRGEGYEDEETFHLTCSKKSNVMQGRTVSEATERWWAAQEAAARKSVFDGPHTPMPFALDEFARWCNRLRPTCTRIWAKSPDFDCVIMIDACKAQGTMWPFRFWEARCCRTIMEAAYPMGDFPPVEMDGPKHDALADAKKQVIEVQHAFHKLGI